MSENTKTLFYVGISKNVNPVSLQNILNELKSKNIEINLNDILVDKFIIKQMLTNEEKEIVHKTFISYGMNGEIKPIS